MLLSVFLLGCGDELPRDRGVLWECFGHVDRGDRTIAAFPADTTIRKCANADVPVADVKDVCLENCEDVFCQWAAGWGVVALCWCAARQQCVES